MAITINVNGLSLCHKGSGGKAHSTLPDVCKTPGNGVPVPYQNEAYSRDLVKGTTATFADGGNMIANSGSQFARSVYDEGGSMGGVISGTHKAETDWISHSFDVFFEGRAACRLTDKLFMNHRNSLCLAGEFQDQPKSEDSNQRAVDSSPPSVLYRRGARDPKKLLISQAEAAQKSTLKLHGVSVSASAAPARAGQVVRGAQRTALEGAGFVVKKTGADANHYTVVLPKPITNELVRKWNELFK